jgi:hypothetical protein
MTDEEGCDSHSTGNNQNPATICTAIGESVQTMRSDVSSSSVGDNEEERYEWVKKTYEALGLHIEQRQMAVHWMGLINLMLPTT